MDNKKHILLLFFFGISNLIGAQGVSNKEFKETMKKTSKCYSQEDIVVSYSRQLIVPETSDLPIESNVGVMYIGHKGKYRLEENGTLIIQNGEYKMSVDSLERIVLIDYFDKDFVLIETAEFEKDSILNLYTISKRVSQNQLIFVLTEKKDKATSIKLTLNKYTFEIISMTYNLPPGNYVSETLEDESIERPILVLKYEPIKTLKNSEDLFSTQSWILEKSKPLKLMNNLTDYILYDTRYSSYQ